MIAIGRSAFLYDAIKHLHKKSYKFDAIITDDGYDEYDKQADDFKKLAALIKCKYFKVKNVATPEIIKLIKEKKTDIAISVNWKYVIPEEFISLFKLGIFNLHMGNLPNYKGNATLNWSIINKEKHIYINVHRMTADLDSGDIIARKKIVIGKNDYINDVQHKAIAVTPALCEETVKQIRTNPQYRLIKGSTKGMRCYPRLPIDSQIDWNKTADEVHRLIRASSRPYKGAYTFTLNGEKVIIWKAYVKPTADKFLAIPGHIINIDNSSGHITVACNGSMLEIEEVEYNGKQLKAAGIFKSIRTRFINIPNKI